jgi:hypothetical protein
VVWLAANAELAPMTENTPKVSDKATASEKNIRNIDRNMEKPPSSFTITSKPCLTAD